MSDRPRKKLFPNPFYVLLLLSSTLFVTTTLAYLVVPGVLSEPSGPVQVSASAVSFLKWFDRNVPLALTVEVALMILFGLLAMLTDRWFPEKG
jgi:hypothetical protein